MIDRRKFLKTSVQTAACGPAASHLAEKFNWAAAEPRIERVGLQLYTVRDLMKDDFDGTIAKVASIGYKEVEFAGYFGRTAQQVLAACEKSGLASISTHIQYDELDDKFPAVVETSATIGL